MIQEVTELAENLFSLNASTSWADANEELLGHALQIAKQAAKSFANRKFRGTDEQFVDECEAEAIYVITVTVLLDYANISRQWPSMDDRRAFYYKVVGYSLKAYFSYWATSTASYLKKLGISADPEAIDGKDFPIGNYMEVLDLWNHAIRTPSERKAVHYYIVYRDTAKVAEVIGRSEKKTKEILSRVKKRIKGVL